MLSRGEQLHCFHQLAKPQSQINKDKYSVQSSELYYGLLKQILLMLTSENIIELF